MTKNNEGCTIEELIKRASSYIEREDELTKIREVYNFSMEKHMNQYRISGEPYI